MNKDTIIKVLFSLVVATVFLLSACTNNTSLGGDSDEHGCRASAGYGWCAEKNKCIRPFEESCGQMTLLEAYKKAESSGCTKQGTLSDATSYNPNSKTWWINMEMKPEFVKNGCTPACVVFENGTAEINWRCTGFVNDLA